MSLKLAFLVSMKITQRNKQQMNRTCATGTECEVRVCLTWATGMQANAQHWVYLSFLLARCNYLCLQLWQLMFTYRAIGFCVMGRIIIAFCWLHICYSVHVLGGTPRLHTLIPHFCNGDVRFIRCVITLLPVSWIFYSRFLKLVQITYYLQSRHKWKRLNRVNDVSKTFSYIMAVLHDSRQLDHHCRPFSIFKASLCLSVTFFLSRR